MKTLWRRANARLYFQYRQYTNLFIFRVVSQHCLRSTLCLFPLKKKWTLKSSLSFLKEHCKITLTKLSFSLLFPCFVFEIFPFLWYANYTYDVVYGEWHIGECYKTKSLRSNHVRVSPTTPNMYILKWFRFIIANIYNILRYAIARILRDMCNLHIKETEISQKRSKGIKNWKITYSIILSVLSNKTNLGFSSPLKGPIFAV